MSKLRESLQSGEFTITGVMGFAIACIQVAPISSMEHPMPMA